MEKITELLRTVLPVLLMLGIGMVCRSRSLLSREGINALKKVVVDIALPALLFEAFASTEYTARVVAVPLLMFLVCLAAWALGRAVQKLFRMDSRFVPFLTTGFEAGMLGYALFGMLYGQEHTGEFARMDLGQVLFVFTAYKALLRVQEGGRTEPRRLARDMLLSPVIIAIAFGILFGATGLYRALEPSGIRGVISSCADLVSAPTAAVILLTIGYDLVLGDIPWASALKVVALRLVIMLALRFAVVALLGIIWPGNPLTQAANVMFILPPPFVLPVFADDEKQRVYVSSALSVSTLAAVAGFALLAAIG